MLTWYYLYLTVEPLPLSKHADVVLLIFENQLYLISRNKINNQIYRLKGNPSFTLKCFIYINKVSKLFTNLNVVC